MIIYYSGAPGFRNGMPETILGNKANVMLTYDRERPESPSRSLRLQRIIKARLERRKK